MEVYEINGATASEVVTTVPEFMEKSEGPEVRELSGIERSVIRDRFRGIDRAELEYGLRWVSSDLLRGELARRTGVARDTMNKLWEKVRDIDPSMELDEMLELIKTVRDIVREGGHDHVE